LKNYIFKILTLLIIPKMFLIYSIEDKLLLKPDDLNSKQHQQIKSYEDIILEKVREKYIGKVKIIKDTRTSLFIYLKY